MNQYILLLRGINVGGHRQVKMADLRALLQKLGYAEVQTYIQSGNVVLKSDKTKAEIEATVRGKIKEVYGFEVPVFVIDRKDLAQIIEQMPYKEVEEEKFLHLTYLAKLPEKELVQKLNPPLNENEAYKLIDKIIYLYCPNGYGRTKLTNGFWEKQLNVAATTRNWKTSKKLLEIGQK